MSDVVTHHKSCEHLIRSCACLTLKQVSDKWGVPESTLREKWAKNELPSFFKIFGRVKTFECWFNIWLKEHQLGKKLGMVSAFASFDTPQRNEVHNEL